VSRFVDALKFEKRKKRGKIREAAARAGGGKGGVKTPSTQSKFETGIVRIRVTKPRNKFYNYHQGMACEAAKRTSRWQCAVSESSNMD
jgi:hypothetical protein